MASSKKIELILNTYELLKTHSPKDVTIRMIASASNCATTTIYKHFSDVEQLILFSSIKYIEDFIVESQAIAKECHNALDMRRIMWQSFAKYAFQNVEVFEFLFWSSNTTRLGDTIYDYYQLFPDEWKKLDGLFTSVYFNDDIEERNRIMTHRVAASGYIKHDDANILSDMECQIFHGLLMKYKKLYRDPKMAKQGEEEFMQMIDSLIEHYRI